MFQYQEPADLTFSPPHEACQRKQCLRQKEKINSLEKTALNRLPNNSPLYRTCLLWRDDDRFP